MWVLKYIHPDDGEVYARIFSTWAKMRDFLKDIPSENILDLVEME